MFVLFFPFFLLYTENPWTAPCGQDSLAMHADRVPGGIITRPGRGCHAAACQLSLHCVTSTWLFFATVEVHNSSFLPRREAHMAVDSQQRCDMDAKRALYLHAILHRLLTYSMM